MKKKTIKLLREKQDLFQTEELKHKFQESKNTSTYKRLLNETTKEREFLREQVQIIQNLEALNGPEVKINPKKISKGESTVVTQYSDIHVEERVDSIKVNGLNEYTPEISAQRNEVYWRMVVRLTEIHRHGTLIDNIIVQLGGDNITGYIHEDLEESNYMSPIEAILISFDMISSGIKYLLKHGKFKKIILICNYGNHGRTTQRSRITTGAENSHEFLMYNFLANAFEKEKRITFRVAKSYHVYATVYDTVIRFHHGDNMRYGGGVGGITIPVKKAISQWNKSKHADIDYFCHFHQLIFHKEFVGNGSLIGWNPYAISIKAEFEKPQQSWTLISKKYGKTAQHPIFFN